MTNFVRKKNVVEQLTHGAAIALMGLITIGLTAEASLADTSSILRGLGGVNGFGDLSQGPNDDGSSSQLNLPFTINFYGNRFDKFYINNNGNLTFKNSLGGFTPVSFPITNQPLIAPYWGDVDTRATGGGAVYVATPNPDTTVVTWDQVGYYNLRTNLLNTFQTVLRNRADTGVGNFDIEYRYGQLQWTTGDASGGSGGFGGTPAQAGFDAGDRVNFFTLPGSRTSAVLNLAETSNVSPANPGLWSFAIRNGGTPGSSPVNPLLPLVTDNGWSFNFNIINPTVPIFIDPDVVAGYNYIVDSGPNIASVLLPTGIGDNLYDLWLDSGNTCANFASSGTTVRGGNSFNFSSPLRCFGIRGIEASAGIDPNNTSAFVTGLTFDAPGAISLRQVPVTVPEPFTILGSLTAGAFGLAFRQKNKRQGQA